MCRSSRGLPRLRTQPGGLCELAEESDAMFFLCSDDVDVGLCVLSACRLEPGGWPGHPVGPFRSCGSRRLRYHDAQDMTLTGMLQLVNVGSGAGAVLLRSAGWVYPCRHDGKVYVWPHKFFHAVPVCLSMELLRPPSGYVSRIPYSAGPICLAARESPTQRQIGIRDAM